MKRVLLIVGLFSLVSAAPKIRTLGFRNLYREPLTAIKTQPDSRIVGGQEATPNSLPYTVFLELWAAEWGWYCGGSLISVNFVVSAAHCLEGIMEGTAHLGAHRPLESESTQVVISIQQIIIHEQYDNNTLLNDISVMRLSQSAPLSDAIQLVSLPSDPNNDFVGSTARASGWGLTTAEGPDMSSVLMYVDLEIITNSECSKSWGNLGSTYVCTAGKVNTGTCYGDSGGPLVANGILVGIVSFGGEVCTDGVPAAYTRVSSFLDWLATNTDV